MPSIGIFDSGVGGLTVLRALRAQYPQANFVYLGDTARVPYGTKSEETISRYAHNAANYLIDRGCSSIVIACNTASAYAAESLRRDLDVPVIDVIEPLAHYVATQNYKRVLILGTPSTVKSKAYVHAIARQNTTVQVTQQACGLFVPLVEEGWTDGPIVDAVVDRYLQPAFAAGAPDIIVLGCTHYPMLHDAIEAGAIRGLDGQKPELIDSSGPAASALGKQVLLQPQAHQGNGTCEFLVTDAPDRFLALATRFLDEPVTHAKHVEFPSN